MWCQSKDFIPICIIFTGFFFILAVSRMPPAHLSVDNLTFFSQRRLESSEYSLMEIRYVSDIENGLFYYENTEYRNDDFENPLKNSYNSLAAIEIKNSTVWFNEQIFHSAPLALHLAINYFNKGNTYTYINKPIILWTNYNIHIILGITMPFTISIVFVKLQNERSSNMWTLQKIACMNDNTQWIVTFLWDISICFLISALYLVFLIVCVIERATWLMALAGLLLFLLSGIALLFFMYLLSLFVIEENNSRAFLKIFCTLLILGLFPFVLYMHILEDYSTILFYIFMILPGFSVLHGTNKIFNNNEKLNLSSYLLWNYPGILDSVFFLSLTSFIYFTIFVGAVVYRRAHFKAIPKKIRNYATVCYPHDDEHVVKEKVRISNMTIQACTAQVVLVDQLEKELPKKGYHVNTISFALNKNVCFGIYGTHHSGKSHLLKQLVGAEGYWFGEVYITGFNIKKQMAKALKKVGYCPQNKGFDGLLTPTELLTFFLMIYGVEVSERLDCLRNISASLELRKYMNTRIKDLPENIKRRINVAVTLVTRKQVFILDEPTRGLPAFDRVLIWNTIKYCRSLGNTIIFSTCESIELKELADYVVTVNDGEMLSCDNPHTLEYKHHNGFYLEIKLYADGLTLEEIEENLNNDVDNLNRFVTFFHQESELLYRCDNVCKYFVPVENITYSYIFGTIEKQRNRLNIADYTLAPFSLIRILKSLQNSRKEKRRPEKASRRSILRDPKILPRRFKKGI